MTRGGVPVPTMDRPSPADRIPFVDLRAQHRALEAEVVAAMHQVVTDGNFILGSQVQEFEKSFAAFIGAAHAVGVSSGLDALRLSLLAIGVGHGDEVIVPANTYIASRGRPAVAGPRGTQCRSREPCTVDRSGRESR